VTLLAIALCVMCQACLVGGQLMLKHGMNATHFDPKPWRAIAWYVLGSLGLHTVWFLLWLALLRDWDLSRLYPFEGLSPPLLVLGAWVFLKEQVPARAWIGIMLIGGGVALVSIG
jgi:undecaprenyl phosphate-alpha-L-ara4N flippase subunit ArnE